MRKYLASLRRNDRGAVAVIFAVSITSLLLVTGAAVDYMLPPSTQRSLQPSAQKKVTIA
jgi:Flp pilus assembly protein TadG